MGLQTCPVLNTVTCPHRNADCEDRQLAAHCQHVKSNKASLATLALIMQISGVLSPETEALLRELKARPPLSKRVN